MISSLRVLRKETGEMHAVPVARSESANAVRKGNANLLADTNTAKDDEVQFDQEHLPPSPRPWVSELGRAGEAISPSIS